MNKRCNQNINNVNKYTGLNINNCPLAHSSICTQLLSILLILFSTQQHTASQFLFIMPFLAHSSTQQRAYSNYFLPFLHTAAHSSGLSDDWRLHKFTPNIYLQPGGLKSSRL